ncbi:hypothetical protein ACFX2I_026871 [Malus domestica]
MIIVCACSCVWAHRCREIAEEAKREGLSDPRLGAIARNVNWETCGGDVHSCPGHFGHIVLAQPFYHVLFTKTVFSVLESVCFRCSRILPKLYLEGSSVLKDPMRPQTNKRKRKDDPEPGPAPAPVQKVPFTAQKALAILQKIHTEPCRQLGFNLTFARPDWMIIQVLPIPPPHVRPFMRADSCRIYQDDLTFQLYRIIRLNNHLNARKVRSLHGERLLELYISQYYNKLPGQPRATTDAGMPIRSICCRLNGREGLIREHLMEEQVFESAQAMVTSDPNIKVDQLGVPWTIALDLTFPEIFISTPLSSLKNRLNEFFFGEKPPCGETRAARSIITVDGKRFDVGILKKNRIEWPLKHGDKALLYCSDKFWFVERHLKDGDIVVLNRQRSLHKMSIMGHRVKVVPGSTFRLNPSITSADFGGDPMRMHVPQSLETRTEVLECVMVPKCMFSPQSNRLEVGLSKDSLLGCCKISKMGTFIEKVTKGEHLSGTLCKDTLGMSTHGLTHVIWKEWSRCSLQIFGQCPVACALLVFA